MGFQDQGHCTGREEEEEEVQGSFWYQGRKKLWEEVVCGDDASAQQEKMSSTVTGSLPPEGHHGGHLGGWGASGSGEPQSGRGSREPQPSYLLLSMNSSREGRGTWLPDPEATLSSPPS